MKSFSKFGIRTLLLAVFVSGILSAVYVYHNPNYRMSSEQYEMGYLTAFRMNGTESAHFDYTSEFWSAQVGFDEGKADFDRIYQHPDVGPLSYSRAERLRDVITHIENSTFLDPNRKKIILHSLKSDWSSWVSKEKQRNGG